MKKRGIGLDFILILIAALVFLADRITKIYALKSAYVKNYGLLFGLCSFPALRWLFVTLLLAVLVFFIYTLSLKEIRKNSTLFFGLLLMTAGLLGNLLDRIIYGFIIDFIRICNISAFNLSDVSISFGALLVIFSILSSKDLQKSRKIGAKK